MSDDNRELTGDDTLPVRQEDGSPSADVVLHHKIVANFRQLVLSQRSILRLSDLLDSHMKDIDDLAVRSREHVEMFMDDNVDHKAMDALVDVFAYNGTRNDSDDDSRQANEVAEEARNVLDQLPQGHAANYIDGIVKALGSPPSDNVLRSSLLVSLVGGFESFANQMLRACYERIPAVAQSSDATFTWSEIAAFDSMDSLRSHVIDNAIDKAFRGSLSDWLDVFRKQFGIITTEQSQSQETGEVFQRRHCIVHNGGYASQRYIDSLTAFNKEPKVGLDDHLPVDHDYLANAADALFTMGISLAWSMAHKLIEDREHQSNVRSFLINEVYFLLGNGRLELAQNVGSLIPLSKVPQDQALIIKVNRWLAFKLRGNFDKVRNEVEEFDTGALAKRFILARHALLDEHEDAYRVASELLREEDSELPLSHYLTWPLLRGTREWANQQGRGAPVTWDDLEGRDPHDSVAY